MRGTDVKPVVEQKPAQPAPNAVAVGVSAEHLDDQSQALNFSSTIRNTSRGRSNSRLTRSWRDIPSLWFRADGG